MEVSKQLSKIDLKFLHECVEDDPADMLGAAQEPIQINPGLRMLTNFIDELRSLDLEKFIPLPKICVVGSQSAGKSSLLESIIGYGILPNGNGTIVTRCPLDLRLHRLQPGDTPYGVFEADKSKTKITDLAQIEKRIREYQDKYAGSGDKKNMIIDEPIRLSFFSPLTPNLSLIDLPGLKRIPEEGQPQDIGNIIEDLIQKYIKDPKTIILGVTAADGDISDQGSILMIMKADPNFDRSIGVLTKIDKMGEGENCCEVLENKKANFIMKNGWFAVKNRSTKDNDDKISVEESRKNEMIWFESNQPYSDMYKENPNLFGVSSLTEKLKELLFAQIQEYMPQTEKEIKEKLNENKKQLAEIGEAAPVTTESKLAFICETIQNFKHNFQAVISGHVESLDRIQIEDLQFNGSHITELFNSLYESQKAIKPSKTMEDVEKVYKATSGNRLITFVPNGVVHIYIRKYLTELKMPAKQLVEDVIKVLMVIAKQVATELFKPYKEVVTKIMKIIYLELEKLAEPALVTINNVIDAKSEYFFTNNQDFLDQNQKLMNSQNGNTANQKIKNAVDLFYQNSIDNLREIIPPIIGFSILNPVQKTIFSLNQRQDELTELVIEDAKITSLREELLEKKRTLQLSLDMFHKIKTQAEKAANK